MKSDQIILRIDDKHGHHIIRKGVHSVTNIGYFTIEGYALRPSDYSKPPEYYFPFSIEEVAREFTAQGKEFRT